MSDDELKALLDNAPVRCGLKSQGHLPTIERLRADGASFERIGREIGWCPGTAAEHYAWHLEAEIARLTANLEDAERRCNELTMEVAELRESLRSAVEQFDEQKPWHGVGGPFDELASETSEQCAEIALNSDTNLAAGKIQPIIRDALARAVADAEAENAQIKSLLRDAFMDHGDCDSGKRYPDKLPHACTACMALYQLMDIVKVWRGPRVSVAAIDQGENDDK